MGGGARPPLDGGAGRPRLGTGPRARCAELAAGNWLSVGGRGGGGIMDVEAEDADGPVGRGGGGMDSVEREKVGGGGTLLGDCTAVAFGVVGDSGCSSCSTAMEGGCTTTGVVISTGRGGGGMAARSASRGSAIVGTGGAGGEACICFVSSFSSSSPRRRASAMVELLRCSQARSVGGSHDGGRIMT